MIPRESIPPINSDVLAELTRTRDRLARCEGAVEQASRHVEAARAAHRRAVEERDELRAHVGRLEDELMHGPDRHPLLAAVEHAGRNGNGSHRREPPADAGAPDTRPSRRTQRRSLAPAPLPLPADGVPDDDETPEPLDYDREMTAAVEAAEARRARRAGARSTASPPARGLR